MPSIDTTTPPPPPASASGDLHALKARLFMARSELVEACPFLGSLVLKLPILITEDPRVQTACLDGRGICSFAKPFLEELEPPALRAVLLHETLHLALDVFARRGDRRPLRWNVAHDFAINLLIKESQFPISLLEFPKTFRPLLDLRFKGLSAEDIYEALPEDLGEIGLADADCLRDTLEGMPKLDKSALAKAILRGFALEGLDRAEHASLWKALNRIPERLRGELPEVGSPWPEPVLARLRQLFPVIFSVQSSSDVWFDLWDALTREEREDIRDSWRHKLLEAAEYGLGGDIGSLPGWAHKLLGPILTPRIPWQTRLAQRLHGHLKGHRRSFSRPGRRSHSTGTVLPGPIRDQAPIGVFVDVSGSVGPVELGAFMAELTGILSGTDAPVRLITWDAEVQEDLLLERLEDVRGAIQQGDLKLLGGGGTDPRCVIRHLSDPSPGELPEVTFGVVLTDGEVPWPLASEWPLDLLVVCTADLPPVEAGYDALRLDLGEPTHA